MPLQDCSLQDAWSLSRCERSRGWNVFGWLFFPNSSKLHSRKILGKFLPTASGWKSPFYFVLPWITSCAMATPPFLEHLQTQPPEQTHLAHERCFLKSGRATLGIAVLGTQSQPLLQRAEPASPGGIAVFQWVSQPLSMFMCSQRVLKYSCCR